MGLETLSRPPHTLNELQQHVIELYADRNEFWLETRESRISMLGMAVSDFQNGQRHGFGPIEQSHLAARIISRIFTVSHRVNSVSINDGMMQKYPESGCVYCHKMPCKCEEDRSAAELAPIDPHSRQQLWSLSDYQHHLNRVYGRANYRRGLDYHMLRLSAEVWEVMEVETGKVKQPGLSRKDIEKEFQLELADCVSRTAAIANMLNIDLQAALLDRYWPVCLRCGQKPCDCRQFNFDQIRDPSEILRYHQSSH